MMAHRKVRANARTKRRCYLCAVVLGFDAVAGGAGEDIFFDAGFGGAAVDI